MKTAEEIFKDNLNENLWTFINTYPVTYKSDLMLKDWIIESMESYASQRESKYRELYEAMKDLNNILEYYLDYATSEDYRKMDRFHNEIKLLESELNLNTK